jgi:hypothetical protein
MNANPNVAKVATREASLIWQESNHKRLVSI